MMISVAICTYNSAEKLAAVLESLRGLLCPPGLEYEILVIDNNSRDGTKKIVADYQAVLGPRLRYVFEGRQGLSHARNRAMKEAAGDVISYIDDDVKVDPGWLAAVAAAFERYDAAVVGGKSYLIYPSARPAWLSEMCEIFLSRLDYGDRVIVGTDKDLYGLNFSVKKDYAVQVGGFNPDLGRRGNSLHSGEESDLLRKIRDLGGVAVYEPGALVGHIVSKERLRMRWFLRRAFQAGVDDEILRLSKSKDAGAFWSVVHLLRCCGSVLRSLVRGQIQSPVLFSKTLAVVGALGYLYGNSRMVWLPLRKTEAVQ